MDGHGTTSTTSTPTPPPAGTPGRTAYVVLNHAHATQVGRLVSAIRRSSPTAHVVVAHDARRTQPLRVDDPDVDVWCHGLRTDWGSWELVEASLGAFERALRVPDTAWFVLLSGHDYPARALPAWEAELGASGGGWVGTAQPLRYQPRWGRSLGQGDDDLTRYAYAWSPLPGPGVTIPPRLVRVLDRVSAAVFLRAEPVMSLRIVRRGRGRHLGVRRVPSPFRDGRECVKGSQWLAMDRRSLESVLVSLAPGTRLRRVFERSIIPDEAAIQSVLHWTSRRLPLAPVSHVQSLPDGTVRVLDETDAAAVLASGSPFCRKVDTHASERLLDRLDRALAT